MTKSALEDPAPLHTLESIAKALGPPEASLLEAVLEGASDADLVDLGRQIASERIVTDDKRLYSMAYDVWNHATHAQKDNLRGFSQELLSLAVHHALELEALDAQHEGRGASNDVSRASRDAAAQSAFAAGLVRRDQAAVVLRGVAGKDAALLAEVDGAVGTAGTGEALATGLEQLAALGKRFLSHKKGTLHARAKLMRLDEAYVTSLLDAAKAVRETTHQASARSGGKRVTQGALDKKDGEAMHLLETVIDAFEKAHDLDPTIPRLVPIATRRLLGKHTRKAPAVVTPPVDASAPDAKPADGKPQGK
jgi:hypothetical protein